MRIRLEKRDGTRTDRETDVGHLAALLRSGDRFFVFKYVTPTLRAVYQEADALDIGETE